MSNLRAFLFGCLTVATVVALDAHRLLWTLTVPVAGCAALWTFGGNRRRRGARWTR